MYLSLTDPVGNLIALPFPPVRIVSLVPSLTELLHSLGLNDEVVGITKFCIRPNDWFKTKQRVGGTKTVNATTVKALQPDLIIASKEENVKEQIEKLQTIAPVYVTDINTLEDALDAIIVIGKLVNKELEGVQLSGQIKTAFEEIVPLTAPLQTAYFIWKDPYMAAGGDTFIDDLLSRCGFINIFKNVSRYPEITVGSSLPGNDDASSSLTYLSSNNCQVLLLSSEPYPFGQKHADELQNQLPGCKVMLTDGEMFSWYGSRLLHAAAYLQKLIALVEQKLP